MCAFNKRMQIATTFAVSMLMFCVEGFATLEEEADVGAHDVHEILAIIYENEKACSNIELFWESEYRRLVSKDEEFEPDVVYTGFSKTVRSVTQDEMLYMSNSFSGSTYTATGKKSSETLGFDGVTSRYVKHNEFANIDHSKMNHPDILTPHMFPFRRWNVGMSLSVFENGSEESNGLDWKWSVPSHESVNGLDCVRLTLTATPSNTGKDGEKKPYQTSNVWFAKTRSYLPIKTISYNNGLNETLPIAESAIDDFIEMAPGIWAPANSTITTYRSELLLKNIHEVDNIDTITVKKALLDPSYDMAFFQNIPIPDNIPVYTIENGEVISTDAPAVSKDDPGVQRWVFALVALGLLGILGFLLYKIYHKNRRGRELQ